MRPPHILSADEQETDRPSGCSSPARRGLPTGAFLLCPRWWRGRKGMRAVGAVTLWQLRVQAVHGLWVSSSPSLPAALLGGSAMAQWAKEPSASPDCGHFRSAKLCCRPSAVANLLQGIYLS